MWQKLEQGLFSGDFRSLARCITLVENEAEGYDQFLKKIPVVPVPILGITGPPGAGKSTLTDALINVYIQEGKRVGILCVDPSSAFNFGALLGDRIRMSEWYNHPAVFIRSLASRGSMGGLHPKIIEISDVMKAAGFDLIIIETVGVGQSEIEIAGLADVTVVVLVPEGGDEVQTMKAGVMEIADIFVVNKADRPGADNLVKHLRQMLAPAFSNHIQEIPILKTIASHKDGIEALVKEINTLSGSANTKKAWLLADRAYQLIRNKRMKDVDKEKLKIEIDKCEEEFNLYRFIDRY